MTSALKSLLGSMLLWPATVAPLAAQTLDIAKTSSCGCCVAWIEHIEAAGYKSRAEDVSMGALSRMKIEAGLDSALHACHTARVEGYVIEGHVPAREIARLLNERPDAIGLTVPGMPAGSPGMEAGTNEPYEVLLVRRDGTTETFARYD